MNKLFRYIFLITSVAVIISCQKSDEPEPDPVTPVLESLSIKSGETVSIDLGTITALYSVPIAVSGTISIGNEAVTAVASNKSLTLTFGTLEYEKEYTLVIPAGAIVNKSDGAPAKEASLTFFTEDLIEPNPDIPDVLNFDIDDAPVNKNATAEARNVYSFLRENFGKKTLSGTMSEKSWNTDMAEWVYGETGKWPAIACFDFMFYTHRDDKYADNYKSITESGGWVDYGIADHAAEWWDEGGIPALMWHWHDPSRNTVAFYCKSDGEKTTFDISKIFDTESEEYAAVISDIDIIAADLKKLQEAGVPVIWRPLHEAEGSYRWGAWFWWGNGQTDRAASCAQLYRTMYDRLVNYHGLNNLIWVWTVNLDDYDYLWYADCLSWYPGDEYVDIIGIDIYDDAVAHGSHLDFFKKTALTAGLHKMVTLAECGHIPEPGMTHDNGEMWSWWMPWNGDYTKSAQYNGDYWQTAFASEYIITRDELPSLK